MDGLALSQEAMSDAAERVWGFRAFRPLQADAVRAVVEGRDSLVVLPTGGGKSLCYQLPPLLTEKLTLVVSPLIALMQDQVDGLRLNGYPAAALHSQIDDDEVASTYEAIEAGELRLLLVSPERAVTGGFLRRVRELGQDGRVGAIAIDEAHCISQWGHDFRPEYRRLSELRERLPGVSMHAYTATATPRVRDDIVGQLGLENPEVLVGRFDRPNLTYRVVPRVRVADQVAEILTSRHAGDAAIVYCMSRRETEQLAESLSSRGIQAGAYHAGMSGEKRRRVQERFTTERLNVVCATVAFGMGIDRSDVRCVIHASMPKSVEAYQQETGRAGRDGLPSECVLLYSSADAARWHRLIEGSALEAGMDEEAIRPQLDLLSQIRRLVSGARCRHKALTEHFGQTYDEPSCGACDVCLDEVKPIEDSTVVAQKILACVARAREATGTAYGAGYIAEILRGRRTQKVVERGHDRLSTFGIMNGVRKELIVSCIDQLVDLELLERSEGEYPVLVLTKASVEVLRGERDVELLAPPQAARAERRRGASEDEEPLGAEEHAVFDRLRALRRRLAEEMGVPPYVVFNDATLRDMVRRKPGSAGQLLEVKGVGRTKADRFGEAFLSELASA
ncbi:MAG: DNA helicase RecQ [Planctomycetota bacterium]